MELQFYLSGSLVFQTEADIVPAIGSTVIFRMLGYKKGIEAGTLVSATVTSDMPLTFDYSKEGKGTVSLDLNEFQELSEDGRLAGKPSL